MARARAQYSGPDFPVMPTGIMSDVNAWLVKREYRTCQSTLDSKSANDLRKLLGLECFPVNCY